jgi:hypothetical protein
MHGLKGLEETSEEALAIVQRPGCDPQRRAFDVLENEMPASGQPETVRDTGDTVQPFVDPGLAPYSAKSEPCQ